MTTNEWQKRLSDTFTVNGLIGGELVAVQKGGRGGWTLTIASNEIVAHGWPKDRLNYPVMLAAFFNLFRRFRACEILYIKGYPLDGYALMRDIKDRFFMLAGVARKLITFGHIIGAPASSVREGAEYKKRSAKNRKDTEHLVTNEFMGKTSGLSPDVQDDLKVWDDFFHLEMHGGGISMSQALGEVSKGRLLQIGPSVIQDAYILYINRSSELGWMVTRLLPYLQSGEGTFGAEWERKRQILDDSFRHMLEGFSNLGKRLGTSFITMIDAKFVFRQPFHYFEADVSDA